MLGVVTGLVIGIVGLTGFVMGTGLTGGMVTVAGDEVSGGTVTVAGVVTGFVIAGAVTGLFMGVVG